MKKVYKVKMEFETYIVADDEVEADKIFWEDETRQGDEMDSFLTNITSIKEIEEATEYIEELNDKDENKRNLKMITCDNCGQELSKEEKEYNKDADFNMCFPCLKGNTD